MHSNRTPFRLMLVVPMLFALTACGSGGGSTTTLTPAFLSPDAFEGSWRQVGISGTAGGPEEVASSWGSVQVAGGTLDFNVLGNQSGLAGLGSVGTGPSPYLVMADRAFATQDLDTGFLVSRGGMSVDADVAARVNLRRKTRPSLRMYLRRGEGLGMSVLSGTYAMAFFASEPAGMVTRSGWGTATFDGGGIGSVTFGQNVEGLPVIESNAPATYSITANGSLTLHLDGTYTALGAVTSDGELAVVAGGTDDTEAPGLYVFVRKGSGFSDASLSGSYFLLGLSQATGTNEYAGTTGILEADGMGMATVQGWRNDEGSISWVPDESVPTSVGPDGALTITTPGEDFVGCLSETGRFGILSGPTNFGTAPSLYVLIR